MEGTEVRKLAALEDAHWWYRERRHLLAHGARAGCRPGAALDVGAAGGGNTRVLRDARLVGRGPRVRRGRRRGRRRARAGRAAR